MKDLRIRYTRQQKDYELYIRTTLEFGITKMKIMIPLKATSPCLNSLRFRNCKEYFYDGKETKLSMPGLS